MPPTRAAARKTACGLAAAIHCSVWSGRRRSTWSRGAVTISQPSRCRRRTSALPTRPRSPATQTRLFRNVQLGLIGIIGSHSLHDEAISFHHLGNQLGEAGAMAPAELGQRLGRVTEQEIDFGRPTIRAIDRHQNPSGALAAALLFVALTTPF